VVVDGIADDAADDGGGVVDLVDASGGIVLSESSVL
jgi:hypothetical protein